MQEQYFKETGEIKQKISTIITTLTEVRQNIMFKHDMEEDANKLVESMKLLKGIVEGNIEELEHLVIVDGVHYKDTL